MTIVFEDLDLPGGGDIKCAIEVVLWGAGRPTVGTQVSTNKKIVGVTHPPVDAAGQWSLDLVGNDDIVPTGTTYRISRNCTGCDEDITFISVPVTGGPFETTSMEVDAMNSVTPPQLSIHASDFNLHGGGFELDFASLSSEVTVTGSAGAVAIVTGVQVTVPDLPRPIYLFGKAPFKQPPGAGPAEAVLAINPALNLGALAILDHTFLEGLNTDAETTTAFVVVRLPPHSAGDYALTAKGNTSNFTAVISANPLNKAILWAETK